MSNKLVYIDDILARAHDVTLEGGAKHRCFDVTLLHELNAVELVQCENCKFRNKNGECEMFDCYTSAAGDLFSPPDWFYCEYGERKEE